MKRAIVGIAPSWDSGASAVDEDGKVIIAINEERLSRKKLTPNYPQKTLSYILSYLKKKKYSLLKTVSGDYLSYGYKSDVIHKKYYKADTFYTKTGWLLWPLEKFRKLTIAFIRINASERFVDHHTAHAAGAYYTSGLKKALVLTMDAYGDGAASTVSRGDERELKILKRYGWSSTVAHAYARLTQYLGFKHHRHEGKITGLAAYGDPIQCYNKFKKLIWIDKEHVVRSALFLRAGFNRKKMQQIFRNYKREDIAAALQKRCEDIIIQWIDYWIKKTGIKDIALAGGVFANVKINQKIHELNSVGSIYVFPQMGDGGLGLGAALYCAKPTPYKLKDVYFGPEFSHNEIKQELKKWALDYSKPTHPEKEVARLLAKGKVVALFQGRMEFGPRALGNRSILYQTTDPKVNDWLNQKLKRTEFMPFAPVTLKKYAKKCYKNLDGAEYTAKFMTITFECTDYMKKASPGVVHIDGTARPQLIDKESNPRYYNVLKEYHKITTIPSIINTSFNIHEEPIVCNPQDAIRAFQESKLDYLLIGDYLITQTKK